MAFRNYIVNPDFELRDFGDFFPIGPSTGRYVANKWWVGPGNGGAANVYFPDFEHDQTTVPGYPKKFMRMDWTTVPTSGEDQYLPECRWTFLEHHMHSSQELMGKPAHYRFYMRVAQGPLHVKPIFWINFQNGSWQIVQDQPVFEITPQWQLISGIAQIPAVPQNQPMDTSHYVGWGLDFLYATMPSIDLAKLAVWSPEEDVVENRPFGLERLLANT